MLRQVKTPYNLFLIMYKHNNKVIDNYKLKLEWHKVKNGISENYPNLNELKISKYNK